MNWMTLNDQDIADAGLMLARDGVVATITLNRPEVRNAQRPSLWAAMAHILNTLPEEVRIVVVRGAGGTFSAGLDLALLDPARAEEEGSLIGTMALSDEAILDRLATYQRPFAMLASPRFISIAVVEGYAIGAGFQLALACDLRIASTDAKFCMKEPALGLVPDLAGTQPLVEAVGYARAVEICASARMVNATDALAYGLVQEVATTAELDSALALLVGSLNSHPVDAVRATKALLKQAPHRSPAEQQLAERMAQIARFRAFGSRLPS